MSLGGIASFPYRQREAEPHPGHIVMLMSGGFPERFDERGEMIDYDRAQAVLAAVDRRPPDEIIERFVREGDEWAGDRAQDDMTFVMMKVKPLTSDH